MGQNLSLSFLTILIGPLALLLAEPAFSVSCRKVPESKLIITDPRTPLKPTGFQAKAEKLGGKDSKWRGQVSGFGEDFVLVKGVNEIELYSAAGEKPQLVRSFTLEDTWSEALKAELRVESVQMLSPNVAIVQATEVRRPTSVIEIKEMALQRISGILYFGETTSFTPLLTNITGKLETPIQTGFGYDSFAFIDHQKEGPDWIPTLRIEEVGSYQSEWLLSPDVGPVRKVTRIDDEMYLLERLVPEGIHHTRDSYLFVPELAPTETRPRSEGELELSQNAELRDSDRLLMGSFALGSLYEIRDQNTNYAEIIVGVPHQDGFKEVFRHELSGQLLHVRENSMDRILTVLTEKEYKESSTYEVTFIYGSPLERFISIVREYKNITRVEEPAPGLETVVPGMRSLAVLEDRRTGILRIHLQDGRSVPMVFNERVLNINHSGEAYLVSTISGVHYISERQFPTQSPLENH